jgi:nitroimidazol reductase NimA-like FMN-containing flavoprotein (pyridoxamine 5'-phosphate oxidase superfamily)
MMALATLPRAGVEAHAHRMSSYGLKVLDRDECASLLATQRIGRVGLATPTPMVLPVQYAVLDGDVVFRTARRAERTPRRPRAVTAALSKIAPLSCASLAMTVLVHRST